MSKFYFYEEPDLEDTGIIPSAEYGIVTEGNAIPKGAEVFESEEELTKAVKSHEEKTAKLIEALYADEDEGEDTSAAPGNSGNVRQNNNSSKKGQR